MTHTDPKQDKNLAWWYVNLGAWYKVKTIRVWNRVECAERLNGAHVYAVSYTHLTLPTIYAV